MIKINMYKKLKVFLSTCTKLHNLVKKQKIKLKLNKNKPTVHTVHPININDQSLHCNLQHSLFQRMGKNKTKEFFPKNGETELLFFSKANVKNKGMLEIIAKVNRDADQPCRIFAIEGEKVTPENRNNKEIKNKGDNHNMNMCASGCKTKKARINSGPMIVSAKSIQIRVVPIATLLKSNNMRTTQTQQTVPIKHSWHTPVVS